MHRPVSSLPIGSKTADHLTIIKIFWFAYNLFSAFKDADHRIFSTHFFPFIGVHFKFAECHLAIELFCFQKFLWLNFMQGSWIKYLTFLINERMVVEIQHHNP